MKTDLLESLLKLVRLGIGTRTLKSSKLAVKSSDNWKVLKTLADEQGLSAVILDALNLDGTNLADGMPQELKLEWIGEVLQDYESRYSQYTKAISSLAGFYISMGSR